MHIRKATGKDLDSILELFEGTVQHVNAKDYSKEQIAIWKQTKDREIWNAKITSQSFFVATINNQIVGFSSIDSDGYLDFMYTHHQHQRQGIATKLLNTIEKEAQAMKLDRVWASVSLTAQAFFAKYGYVQYDNEHKLLSGVHFKNALMEKAFN